MLVAAHVAHGRQLWTTCRRRCTSELCSSRLRTAEPSTHETRGQACWSRTLPVEMQPPEGADPSITDQTCLLRATPAYCDFARLALRISQHRSPSSQHKPRYRLCTVFLVLPTSSELCPRAYVRESNPCDKRRGLLVLLSASCSATLQRSRDLFAPRYASILYNCQPLAPRFTSIDPRAASACLGTASAPLFFVLPTSSELCPRAGVLESERDNQRPRKHVLPFCRGSHLNSC